MRCLALHLLVGLTSVAIVQGTLLHYILYKSFPNALGECAEYLEIPETTLKQYVDDSYPDCAVVHKLIHCAMVNLCAWNDTTGIKEHVMEGFFAPHPNDTCFLKVTQNCIQESLLPLSPEAHNSRAYAVFKCYLRHYGDLVHEAKFVPNEHLEFDQLIQDCFTLASIPRDELIQYSRGNIIDGASFPRGFLIGCVRLGYYSLQTGVNLGTFYAQFGNREILSQQTRECCERSAREHCDEDHATRLYYIFRNCLVDIVPTLGLVQKYAKSLVGEVC